MAHWSEARWNRNPMHGVEDTCIPQPVIVAPRPEQKYRAQFNGQVYYFTAATRYVAYSKAMGHWPNRGWGTPSVEEV